MAEAEEVERGEIVAKQRIGKRVQKFFIVNWLIFAILAGLIFGVILGIIMKVTRKDGIFTKREVMYVDIVGKLYIRALKLTTLPLIIVSIVASLAGLSLRFAGMLGLRTFLYYLATNLLAVIWGIILVYLIHPGRNVQEVETKTDTTYVRQFTMIDSILDLIRSVFPENLVDACIRTYKTDLIPPKIDVVDENGSAIQNPDGTVQQTIDKDVPLMDWKYDQNSYVIGTNYLGICVFSIAFGIATIVITKSTLVIRELFNALNEIILVIVTIIIWTSPFGVLSLIAGKIIEEKNWANFIAQVGWYSLTVLVGILTYGFIFLQLVYLVFTRKNPLRFTFNMIEALTTAFATASSLVTLPVTLRCVIQKNGIPAAVARFVVPLGATVNMNGTALYEAVAPIFIAQVLKQELTVLQIFLTCIIATLASVGAAGIPQAGLVTMVMVLTILNLDADTLIYILAVDWLLDRFRTALNIFGDAVGAAVVYAFSKRAFKEMLMAEMAQEEF